MVIYTSTVISSRCKSTAYYNICNGRSVMLHPIAFWSLFGKIYHRLYAHRCRYVHLPKAHLRSQACTLNTQYSRRCSNQWIVSKRAKHKKPTNKLPVQRYLEIVFWQPDFLAMWGQYIAIRSGSTTRKTLCKFPIHFSSQHIWTWSANSCDSVVVLLQFAMFSLSQRHNLA